MTEDRRQTAEDRGQTAEDRGQRSEVRIARDKRERTKARKGKNLPVGIV